ncbi:MAG TPA: HEAT repeat domain-containing protein, partial [Isosphaeraceae bacterium]|nr:HEAT repeat domain-containing protein [Isosphaeraceae bacterium]
ADGSLLVVNTGGWYKLCCPTSQFPKPDVLGGIYRVRRVDAKPVEDPRGLKLEWEKASAEGLAERLGDARPAVRNRARRELAGMGESAVGALTGVLTESKDTTARENAVWALGSIADSKEARDAVTLAITDPDDDVRQAALNSAALHRDTFEVGYRKVLNGKGMFSSRNRRVAAEGLGRIPQVDAVPLLLESLRGASDDWALENALISALIDIGDADQTARGLDSGDPQVQRGALIGLDQMGAESLDPKQVAGFLASTDSRLREAASWVLSHHAEWGDTLAEGLRTRLRSDALNDEERADLEAQLARFSGSKAVEALLADQIRDEKAPLASRRSALKALAQSGRKEPPARWVEAVVAALKNPDLMAQAVATAKALSFGPET